MKKSHILIHGEIPHANCSSDFDELKQRLVEFATNLVNGSRDTTTIMAYEQEQLLPDQRPNLRGVAQVEGDLHHLREDGGVYADNGEPCDDEQVVLSLPSGLEGRNGVGVRVEDNTQPEEYEGEVS